MCPRRNCSPVTFVGTANLMSNGLVLGFDVGTRSIKAGLFDYQGGILGKSEAPLSLCLPAPGWAEQHPQNWWMAMGEVSRKVIQQSNVAPGRVQAIGVCAQMSGVVPVDKQGVAVRDALVWLDTRSAPIARRITRGTVNLQGYGIGALRRWFWTTNGAPSRAGKDPISKILWLRENEPEHWRKVHKLLDVKDYIVHRLCGAYTTTADCAHLTWLFDSRPKKWGWAPQLLSDMELDEDLFPSLRGAADIVGRVHSSAARELGVDPQTQVVGGCGDLVASALGAGATTSTTPFASIGTSAWLGIHRQSRYLDPFSGVATICSVAPEHYLLVAAQECAGACVEWGIRMLGLNETPAPLKRFDELASVSPPGARGVMFLPWMFGERVPIQDTHVRGALVNLSLQHGAEDIARAILEGVALNLRWALKAMRWNVPIDSAVRFVGGGAKSLLWSQILADVLMRPIERMEVPELAGARGAAVVAAAGILGVNPLTDALGRPPPGETIEPVTNRGEVYDALFQRFVSFYRRTRRWY